MFDFEKSRKCSKCENIIINDDWNDISNMFEINNMLDFEKIPTSIYNLGLELSKKIADIELISKNCVQVYCFVNPCAAESNQHLLKEIVNTNHQNKNYYNYCNNCYSVMIDLSNVACEKKTKTCCCQSVCPLYVATWIRLWQCFHDSTLDSSRENLDFYQNDIYKTPKLNFTTESYKNCRHELSSEKWQRLLDYINYILDKNYIGFMPQKKKNMITVTYPQKFIDNFGLMFTSLCHGEIDTLFNSSEINTITINMEETVSIKENLFLLWFAAFVESFRRNGTYKTFEVNWLNEISTIDDLLAGHEDFFTKLQCASLNNLYCSIACDDSENAVLVVDKIYESLKKNEKIKKYVKNISISNFASAIKTDLSSAIESDTLYHFSNLKDFVEDIVHPSREKQGEVKKNIALLNELSKYKQNRYIVFTGMESEINSLLQINNKLKFLYSENLMRVAKTPLDSLFNAYKLKLSYPLQARLSNDNNNDIKIKFLEALNEGKATPLSEKELVSYIADYSNLHNDFVFPSFGNSYNDLFQNIVGLNDIKQQIEELKTYLEFLQASKSTNLKLPVQNLHMCFLGSPGTGKTVIARILAHVLYQIGICRKDNLIEVSRKDLVGDYIGHTAIKTQQAIDKAMGGVLFIDEAYALCKKDSERDFGLESIATLLKAMEDCKNDLIVIFAGYEKETMALLDSNSGLRSRIGYTFYFQDYNIEELTQIFIKCLTSYNFLLEEGIEKEVEQIIKPFMLEKGFGNGRFIDKVIQLTIHKHSKNYKLLQNGKLDLIIKEDLPTIEEIKRNTAKEEFSKKGKIGFNQL